MKNVDFRIIAQGIERVSCEKLISAIRDFTKAVRQFQVTADRARRAVFPKMRPRRRKKIIRVKQKGR